MITSATLQPPAATAPRSARQPVPPLNSGAPAKQAGQAGEERVHQRSKQQHRQGLTPRTSTSGSLVGSKRSVRSSSSFLSCSFFQAVRRSSLCVRECVRLCECGAIGVGLRFLTPTPASSVPSADAQLSPAGGWPAAGGTHARSSAPLQAGASCGSLFNLALCVDARLRAQLRVAEPPRALGAPLRPRRLVFGVPWRRKL